jgi:diguanylate cyclase (GGDEF)-like protein
MLTCASSDDNDMSREDQSVAIKRALRGRTNEQDKLAPTRPRKSIARRMMYWMLGIAIVPAVICMVLFNYTVQDYLNQRQANDNAMLGDMLAASLTGRLHHFARNPGELLDGLSFNPRTAFVCVLDSGGKLLHAGVFDNAVWSKYDSTRTPDPGTTAVTVDKLSDGFLRQTTVHTIPILSRARGATPAAGRGQEPKLEGYVVLALRDDGLRTAITGFQWAQILIVLIVSAIILPVVAVILRRWLEPWRELVVAARLLAEGNFARIKPVTVRGEDEVGFLAATFNDMASKLLLKRRELEDANASLEQTVLQRTLELQVEKEKLDTAAHTDILTGLANRRAFGEAMKKHFAQAHTYGGDLCVLLIDLDGFKSVNDTYGHDIGDEVLKVAAESMKRHCKNNHLAIRMGGDEFMVLMPATKLAAAAAIADQIRNDFAHDSQALFSDTGARVSMSQGLANIDQAHPEDATQLIAQADKALYAAKAAGKSCLVIFDPQAHVLAEAA